MRLPIAILALLSLSACASAYDLSTPEGVARYQRDLAISQQSLSQGQQLLGQQTQALQAQAAQTPNPQVLNPAQPNATSTYYCRDLTGTIVTCRQIN